MHVLTAFCTVLAGFNFIFWALCALSGVLSRRNLRFLSRVSPEPADRVWPLLAVVVPARNEEREVQAALESLANQDYPGLIILPVDDRSTDRTGALMDEVATHHPHLHPMHLRTLPAEWLGKNHANAMGAQEAKRRGAEWILFTDGDIKFGPSALRKAIAYAQDRRLDHLSVTPELTVHRLGEIVFVTTFSVWFSLRFRTWEVENPKSKQFIGIGAFNMIRSDVYEAIGGHERLALTVADDMALGKLVKSGGFRQGFLNGQGEVAVRWQPGLWQTVRGLYKNSFASMDFSLVKTLRSALFLLVVNVLPYFLIAATAGKARALAVGGLGLLFFSFAQAARYQCRSWGNTLATGLLAGFGGILFIWTLLASAWVTLRQGGVVWRGTLYPLPLLRDRQVRL